MDGPERTARLRSLRAILLAVAGVAVGASPAAAQQGRSFSQEVVQQLPARDNVTLNEALARLGRNPRDVEALIDAGNAALAMGDADAAVGFFSRADQIAPGSPRVKAGLAGALVRNENPFDAIPLFDEAEVRGGLNGAFIADRGLAYDLVGDNATAQRYYRQALTQGANDEATRRLALSLAMSGDKQGAEKTLASLLARQDKASFRTRAFALAIAGDVEGAVAIANASLPQRLAADIAPYLRYMPRLTRAQQAAAANFGHFPRASQIGQDDPRIARYTAAADAAAQAAKANSSGSRGRSSRDRNSRNARIAVAPVAPPQPPAVSREVSAPGVSGKAAAQPAAPATPARQPQVAANTPRPAPQTPAPAPTPAPASRGIMGPVSEDASAAAPRPPVAPTPAPLARPSSVADAFGDFGAPAPGAAPTPGAVDIRKITPARPKPKEEAKAAPPKPAPPSHPSRIWVQVAAGRNKDALAFDWRKMTREAPEAFRGKKANVSASGQSNRLLAGPFPTEAAAATFITQLRRANVNDAFVWTSPAGQVVDALATP